MADSSVNLYFNEAIKVADHIATSSLEKLLKEDQRLGRIAAQSCSWYHGDISKDDAERMFERAGYSDGKFLVRKSKSTPKNFALSLCVKRQIHHFAIHCVNPFMGGFYDIDDNNKIFGLDSLVLYYEQSAEVLPSKLRGFCPGAPPPGSVCLYGNGSLLHQALWEGDSLSAMRIMKHPLCPDVNSKDERGATPLHLACSLGLDAVLSPLIEKGADLNSWDSSGYTPLHRAAALNLVSVVRSLVARFGANPHSRCLLTGWLPIHEAAAHGHTDTVAALLDSGSCLLPQTDNGETPRQVAEKFGKSTVCGVLDSFKVPDHETSRGVWYHGSMSREGALVKLTPYRNNDGVFLVRASSSSGCDVISMMCNGTDLHFEIRPNSAYPGHLNIQHGPILPSLEHLVAHYGRWMDGLACKLDKAVAPDGTLKDIRRVKPTIAPRPKPPQPRPPPSTSKSATRGVTKRRSLKPIKSRGEAKFNLQTHGKSLSIRPKDVKLEFELGQGEYGSVYKGTWKTLNGKKVAVAVKTFRPSSVSASADEFLKEAAIMVQLDHPQIVKLIGVCKGQPIMLVQELMEFGALLDYLLDYPERIKAPEDMYLWAGQIAAGMLYLEEKKYVHRDLATRNILLAGPTKAKISDFGLSRAVSVGKDYYKASKGGRWPVKWYAPESMNYGTFSHLSDVWSFGVCLWEIFSFGEQPFGDISGAQALANIERGYRLERPGACPEKEYQMMLKCWAYKPGERPSFAKLWQHFQREPEYISARELMASGEE